MSSPAPPFSREGVDNIPVKSDESSRPPPSYIQVTASIGTPAATRRKHMDPLTPVHHFLPFPSLFQSPSDFVFIFHSKWILYSSLFSILIPSSRVSRLLSLSLRGFSSHAPALFNWPTYAERFKTSESSPKLFSAKLLKIRPHTVLYIFILNQKCSQKVIDVLKVAQKKNTSVIFSTYSNSHWASLMEM